MARCDLTVRRERFLATSCGRVSVHPSFLHSVTSGHRVYIPRRGPSCAACGIERSMRSGGGSCAAGRAIRICRCRTGKPWNHRGHRSCPWRDRSCDLAVVRTGDCAPRDITPGELSWAVPENESCSTYTRVVSCIQLTHPFSRPPCPSARKSLHRRLYPSVQFLSSLSHCILFHPIFITPSFHGSCVFICSRKFPTRTPAPTPLSLAYLTRPDARIQLDSEAAAGRKTHRAHATYLHCWLLSLVVVGVGLVGCFVVVVWGRLWLWGRCDCWQGATHGHTRAREITRQRISAHASPRPRYRHRYADECSAAARLAAPVGPRYCSMGE